MKSIEQQKAELLDELFNDWNVMDNYCDEHTRDALTDLHREYIAITAQKPLSQNPFADEVFRGNCGSRLINHAIEHTGIERKNLRLSDMPPLSWYKGRRGINSKSLWVYEETMREHGMNDKLNTETNESTTNSGGIHSAAD